MDHSNMDMSSSSNMDSSSMSGMDHSSGGGGMAMTFTTNHNIPLFSLAWKPTTTGQYAGTCIFLIVLALIARLLQAYRHILEVKWHDCAVKRRYIVLADDQHSPGGLEKQGRARVGPDGCPAGGGVTESGADTEEAVLTTRGVDERVRVIRSSQRGLETTPWRFGTEVPRAAVFTVQSGVTYLLMLAVMTMNVGFFMSVLAGYFVGELAVGRFAHLDDGHH